MAPAPDVLAHASVGGGDECHPSGERRTLADELVNDGDDATLGMHKGDEREDVFAKDGSLPDPACKAQIKGLNINWACTVLRRLALRRFSRRETTNEYVASLAVTSAAPASVIEFVAPSPAVAYATPTTASEYVAPAPADVNAAPDPVFKYVASSPAVTYAALTARHHGRHQTKGQLISA